jgi:hypothetical protein
MTKDINSETRRTNASGFGSGYGHQNEGAIGFLL